MIPSTIPTSTPTSMPSTIPSSIPTSVPTFEVHENYANAVIANLVLNTDLNEYNTDFRWSYFHYYYTHKNTEFFQKLNKNLIICQYETQISVREQQTLVP